MDIVANMVAGHEWSAYNNKPPHPVHKWGRALSESLSITWDRQGRPLLFRGRMQAVVPRACIPVTRVMPKDAPSCALLAAQEQGHLESATSNHKGHCFQARLQVQNDLKMLKVQTWAQKDEARRQWLRPGSPMVCDFDDFLGGVQREEELDDLMEKF